MKRVRKAITFFKRDGEWFARTCNTTRQVEAQITHSTYEQRLIEYGWVPTPTLDPVGIMLLHGQADPKCIGYLMIPWSDRASASLACGA